MFKVKSQFEIKEVDEKQGILVCYPSIYGVIDSDNDMVMPGAFEKTIGEWGPGAPKPRIKHLLFHKRELIVGIPKVMKGDNDKGLYVESLFGKDQLSQETLQKHIDGLISEMSFGYEVMKSEPAKTKDGKDYNRLTELKMWEYSSVTWGANYLTDAFSGVKAHKEDAIAELDERMSKLIKACRNPKYIDETLEGFELELKQIQAIYKEILLKQEPAKVTPEPTDKVTLIRELNQILFT